MKHATLIAAAFVSTVAQAATNKAPSETPFATPPGVTIKVVQIGQIIGVPGSNGNQPRERVILADDKGRTLYASDQDTTPNKSACAGDCAAAWPPFAAAADAKPTGQWTIGAREDGTKQWAYRGKPLYLYRDEGKGGEGSIARSPGANDGGGLRPSDGTSVRATNANTTSGHDVDGHHVFEFTPEQWMERPRGVGVAEVRTAPGYVLVNGNGTPFYLFNGKPGEKPGADWAPALAPQIALPVGEFTIINRNDGILQWAYKGKAMYAFKGDALPGDANGIYDDARFEPAYVLRFFTPANVKVRRSRAFGGVLTTADDHTLYAREIGHDGGDSAMRSERGDPVTGTRLGLSACDAACEQQWRPFLAPDDAQPSGYWNVYLRSDGKKQWGYYGYALYTFTADGPGQMNGNLIYDAAKDARMAELGKQQVQPSTRWRVAPP